MNTHKLFNKYLTNTPSFSYIVSKYFNNKVDIDEYRNETGGEKFTIIKNWFFDI